MAKRKALFLKHSSGQEVYLGMQLADKTSYITYDFIEGGSTLADVVDKFFLECMKRYDDDNQDEFYVKIREVGPDA